VAVPVAPTDALLFELAGSRMALVAALVTEVVRAVEMQPLPQAPAVVVGMINVRGELMPVLDLRRRFGLQTKDLSPDDHFIVADCGGNRVALHVDRAVELLSIQELPIEPLRQDSASPYAAGALAVEDGVLVIYDLSKFLSATEAATLQLAMRSATELPPSEHLRGRESA
jgi:purine-binding chemotaxis protein CheW